MAEVWTGARALGECLVRSGVERVYGVVGTTLVGFLNGLLDYRERVEYISVRHEQAAGGMADAEGRLTGRPGVCVLHGGPGALNAALSLEVARKDFAPMVAICGNVARGLERYDGMTYTDLGRVLSPLTKEVFRCGGVGEIPGQFARAWATALAMPRGPVVLEVPQDLWGASEPVDFSGVPPVVPRPPAASLDDAQRVVGWLHRAERPLILAGGGVMAASAWKELREFAERWCIPVVTTGNGRGALPEDHPLCLGKAGYGGGNMASDYALEKADHILAVGAAVSDMSNYHTSSPVTGRVVAVDVDPRAAERSHQPDGGIEVVVSDAGEFLRAALEIPLLTIKDWEPWRKALGERRAKWARSLQQYVGRAKPPLAARAMSTLRGMLPRDAIVASGAGLHLIYAMDFFPCLEPRTFLYSHNYGAMGFGLAAAMGAKKAYPQREVVAVLGDGEFMMTLGDLETAVRHKIGVRILIVNDNSYRVLRAAQVFQYKGRIYGTEHSNPDFVRLAEAFGCPGYRLEDAQGLEKVLREALAHPGPVVIEAPTDPNDLPPTNLESVLRMRK